METTFFNSFLIGLHAFITVIKGSPIESRRDELYGKGERHRWAVRSQLKHAKNRDRDGDPHDLSQILHGYVTSGTGKHGW